MVTHISTLGSVSKVKSVATSHQINNTQTTLNSTAPVSKKDTKITDHANSSKPSKKRKIDAIDSSEVKKTKLGNATKKTKVDHAQSIQPAKDLSDVKKRFTVPVYALWHQGRQSNVSPICFATQEHDHEAKLQTIKHEMNEMFTCHITVQLADTSVSCIGFCNVPVDDMDKDIAVYFRTRTKPTKGEKLTKKEKRAKAEFNIEEVSMGTALDDVSGLVRLGRVIDEDYILDTYTLEAEFGHRAAKAAWRGEVYVPKELVPQHKLVDHIGEQNSVSSIETVSEETQAHEEALERSCTVDFSRVVQVGGIDRMPASFWSPDGEECTESEEVHIIASPLDDEHIELHIRARQDDDSWWHMRGSMHKELTSGRFVIVPETFSNYESEVYFAWHLDSA